MVRNIVVVILVYILSQITLYAEWTSIEEEKAFIFKTQNKEYILPGSIYYQAGELRLSSSNSPEFNGGILQLFITLGSPQFIKNLHNLNQERKNQKKTLYEIASLDNVSVLIQVPHPQKIEWVNKEISLSIGRWQSIQFFLNRGEAYELATLVRKKAIPSVQVKITSNRQNFSFSFALPIQILIASTKSSPLKPEVKPKLIQATQNCLVYKILKDDEENEYFIFPCPQLYTMSNPSLDFIQQEQRIIFQGYFYWPDGLEEERPTLVKEYSKQGQVNSIFYNQLSQTIVTLYYENVELAQWKTQQEHEKIICESSTAEQILYNIWYKCRDFKIHSKLKVKASFTLLKTGENFEYEFYPFEKTPLSITIR